ncbi:hypothetical protein AAHB66_13070 [Leclercia sp. S52]|uniref:hypothetical protein n=1 Tax=Leclercia sp. S52 TaxID=3138178 RepID=UPI0032190645
MAITTFVRKISKVIYFITLFIVVGRLIGDPELWFNDGLATRIGHFIYGPDEIGADNFYDLYLYIHIITILPGAIFIYAMTMKLIKKLRSK